MNNDGGGKDKKTMIAGGIAALVTALAGVAIPTDLLLEIWNAMPWV